MTPNRRRIVEGDGDPRHGTPNGYSNHTCRCDECRSAWTDYCRTYRQSRRIPQTPKPEPVIPWWRADGCYVALFCREVPERCELCCSPDCTHECHADIVPNKVQTGVRDWCYSGGTNRESPRTADTAGGLDANCLGVAASE